MSAGRVAGSILGAAAVAGLATLAWGVFVERNRFTVRHETVPVLAPGSRPLTILHLSDLHMLPAQRAKQDFVRSLAALEPDLVIDTGDNLGHRDGLEGVRRALEPFAGVPGVFAHGSNDYFGPQLKNPFRYFAGPSSRGTSDENHERLDTEALNGFLGDELGWWDLNNAVRAVELKGSRIEFVGTADAHRGWDSTDEVPGSVARMREHSGWSKTDAVPPLTVGVTHAPYQRVLDAFVDVGSDVIFAGHTHGGQVRIPGRPALVTNCDIPHAQAQGLSMWHTMDGAAHLQVSAGLGTSMYAPVRFACPPEAVVVTLTAADAA
ncbi:MULTISPECIES: metallophosphoesterase [unclassified Salinibacterium]|uniref:metallophosphoesterase n=1 Tax=unclassified Salinibacterium TaxID=2632331 RepID=UPI00142130E9|nr:MULTISPECIES: metallophosphoesterase [unclassified Salinibacterium]